VFDRGASRQDRVLWMRLGKTASVSAKPRVLGERLGKPRVVSVRNASRQDREC
jgi:hypothetical protein